MPLDVYKRQALHRARERRSRQGANAGPGRVREMLESIVPPRKPIERLTIRSQGRICIINPLEIDWISAADNYAELHVASATHLLRTTLSSLLAQLPADRFVRISRSHVVNVDRIKELRSKSHGDYLVLLQDGKRLTGSRTFRQNLMPLLGSSH